MTSKLFANRNILVMAFEGWNDAGEAASAAVTQLGKNRDLVPLMMIEPDKYYDYQFNRPTIATEDGKRYITWPGATLSGPRLLRERRGGRTPKKRASSPPENNIFLFQGSEPSRQWMGFTEEIIDAAHSLDIDAIVTVGSMLADVPHTRHIPLLVTSENHEVRQELDIERATYEGPVGIMSSIGVCAEEEDIAVVNVWASIPHYVHNAPSPKATLAIVEKLEELLHVTIPRDTLIEDAVAWEKNIDQLADDDDDMAAYIRQLEQARDTVDSPKASGEAIAQEFERFLQKSDEHDAPPSGT